MGSRSFVIEIDTMRYEFDANVMKLSLQLHKVNKRLKINESATFVNDINDFSVVNWSVNINPNGKLSTLYNVTFDQGCKLLDNSFGKANLFFGVVVKNVKKFIPEIPSKCPLKKIRLLTIRNFDYDEDMFPPYMPEFNFSCVAGLITEKRYAFKVFINGHVASKSSELFYRKKL
ncbi:uncharacterized protein LOC131995684 [Stomoxys calcitrans]|uniref:uncharacterized protein LOC131995684 n=1 Tax=Stomoxys calcitrans TaxID=35570 RepID=UPI0027E3061C|nr:uncharacterized protein LOC131995684 [Stomoxys calcitrans]